jgi:hypothetical protein
LDWQDNFPSMKKKQYRIYIPYITIAVLTLLVACIFFINNNQLLLKQRSNRSNITENALATPPPEPPPPSAPASASAPAPALTNQSNLTSAFDNLMSPKVLMGSAIDQIRNSTAKTVASNNNNETAVVNGTIFVINPRVLLLPHQIIPPKDFILAYDSMPSKIINGQLLAKLPCDSNSKSPLQILVGQLSEVKPAKLGLIPGLSQPGYVCMYYANLTSPNNDIVVNSNTTGKYSKVDNITTSEVAGPKPGLRTENMTMTYVELFNPTNYRVVLPNTASLSISVNQLMPLEPHHTNGTTAINKTPSNTTNQLTRTGISPAHAFVYNAWNPYIKQKTYLPVAPQINETILSNNPCGIHAIWQSLKEEQSDLAELKEYSIVTNNTGDSPPIHLYVCGGAPIP